MSANLTHDERWVYERLIDESALFSPMSEVEAAIYTVLLTRRYTGPRARVRKIVQYFNPGTTGADIERAIESMVSGNLLNGTGDQISLRPDWDVTLAQAIQPRGGFPEQFLDYVDRIRRSREEELLERVGHAADARATQRMRVRIGQATNRIRIGCFSASVLLNDIEDALQRVCAGAHKIQVQVLMFSPELGVALEKDPAVENDIERGLEDFRALFTRIVDGAAGSKRCPSCELRWLPKDGVRLAGVHRMLLIDDAAWMFNVHRLGVDRGVDGLVYQGESHRDAPTTFYNMADFYWCAAWEASQPKLSMSPVDPEGS